MSRVRLLNIEVDNLTMEEALDTIDELIQRNTPSFAVTPNVDHIVQIENGGALAEIYKKADLVLTDGKPLIYISRLFHTPIKEKVSGSDLFPLLCERAAARGYRVFFLGAADGVAEMAAEKLKARISGLQISGIYSPKIGFENSPEEVDNIINRIKAARPHILIVSLGCPKQEIFINEHLEEMEVPFSIGLGASIDFESGIVKRAPRWMRNIGLEWLHRIFQDPKRLVKRYLVDDRKIVPIYFKYKKLYRKEKANRENS